MIKKSIKPLLGVLFALQLSACSQNSLYSPSSNNNWGMNGAVTPPQLSLTQTETDFKIISYNLKGIPPLFKSDVYTENNEQRALVFANYLKSRLQQNTAADVVLLQEVFDPTFLWTLIKNSGYSHYYTDYSDNYTLSNVFSGGAKAVPSGLLILSKHPIIKSGFHSFPYTLCALNDCYAKKGVLWAKIQKAGMPFPIDIFNTHLQASTTQESVREKQIKNMEDFVSDRVNNADAVFFGGDFNFRMNESYQTDDIFVDLFEQQDSFLSCLEASDCQSFFRGTRVRNEIGLLDHVFYKADSHVDIKVLQVRSTEETLNLNGKVSHLSDHPMLELSYKLRWK